MESASYIFMDKFAQWVQTLSLYPQQTFKKQKSQLASKSRCFIVLTNHGKNIKTSLPVQLWAKVQKLNADEDGEDADVGFEILDSYHHKRYTFEYHKGDRFPYRSKDLDSEAFIRETHNYSVTPYKYDMILGYGGGYRVNPLIEDSPVIDLYSYDSPSGGSRKRSSTSTPEVPTDERTSNGASTTFPLPRNVSDDLYSNPENELRLLKKVSMEKTAQILLYEIYNDTLNDQLRSVNDSTKKSFSIHDYEVRRVISSTSSGIIYGVQNKFNHKMHCIREVMINTGDPHSSLKRSQISNEINLLKELQKVQPPTKHILVADEISFEKTPLRESYYVLSEPTMFSLRELSTMIKSSSPVNKKLIPIIAGQVISGLSFLKDVYHRIHGNLTPDTILIDLSGFVKLSCLEYSYETKSVVAADSLLTGKEDLLYKHISIFQAIESETDLTVNSNLDFWSLGCIVYKLITGNELFRQSNSWKTNLALYEKKVRSQVIQIVPDFMVVNYLTGAELEPSFFLFSSSFKDSINSSISEYFQPKQGQPNATDP